MKINILKHVCGNKFVSLYFLKEHVAYSVMVKSSVSLKKLISAKRSFSAGFFISSVVSIEFAFQSFAVKEFVLVLLLDHLILHLCTSLAQQQILPHTQRQGNARGQCGPTCFLISFVKTPQCANKMWHCVVSSLGGYTF